MVFLLLQNALARRLPFCYATMLGTHNSGITLADGYGVLDPYFQKYFEWVKFAVSALFGRLAFCTAGCHRSNGHLQARPTSSCGLDAP